MGNGDSIGLDDLPGPEEREALLDALGELVKRGVGDADQAWRAEVRKRLRLLAKGAKTTSWETVENELLAFVR